MEGTTMAHTTAGSPVSTLREQLSRFRILRAILTNNGTHFTSDEFPEFLQGNNGQHLLT